MKNLRTVRQSAYGPWCRSKHNTTKQVFVSFNMSMNYLPIIDYHITTGSYLAAKLYDSNEKTKYLISAFNVVKNQLPFPTSASILSFQIPLPNTTKHVFQILLPYLLPNRRFSRIFPIFWKNFLSKQNISTVILSQMISSKNPTTMHCNAKRYPLLLGEKEREE